MYGKNMLRIPSYLAAARLKGYVIKVINGPKYIKEILFLNKLLTSRIIFEPSHR